MYVYLGVIGFSVFCTYETQVGRLWGWEPSTHHASNMQSLNTLSTHDYWYSQLKVGMYTPWREIHPNLTVIVDPDPINMRAGGMSVK